MPRAPRNRPVLAALSSNLDIFRDRGFVAVVLSNQDGGSEALTDKMRNLAARIR